jgi:surface protein
MGHLFSGCSSLEYLNLSSSFKTDNTKNIDYMFENCKSLKFLNLSSFKTSSINLMQNMFYGCSSLETLDISSFDTSSVTRISEMFYECNSLNSLILSDSFNKFNTINEIISNSCIDIIVKNNKNNNKFQEYNNNCHNFILINIFSDNKKELKFINYEHNKNIMMYVNGSKYNEFTDTISIESGKTSIKLFFPNDIYSSCDYMFKDIIEITSISFKNFNVCSSSREMFSGCSSLKTLNIKSINTKDITDMYRMFSGCLNLESLGDSSFDITNSQNIDNMFCDCKKLKMDNTKFSDSSFTCVEQCKGEKPYLLEKENICVKNCKETIYKYLIEDNKNICVSNCKETEYKYTIINNKTCY